MTEGHPLHRDTEELDRQDTEIPAEGDGERRVNGARELLILRKA
jgi:hypothetical protein